MRGAAVAELYFWDGWQCVVEATTAGAVTKEYVYGEGIDEVLKARLPDAADLDSDSNTSEKVDLYYHQNSLGSVVAVTDSAGDVVESYRYSPYGEVSVFDASGSPTSGNATLVEQPFMFTGRRWDFEEGSGLYYYRLRYYDPVVGRFVQRDPLGMWGDPGQLGSGQRYCAGDPVNSVDPLGLHPAAVAGGAVGGAAVAGQIVIIVGGVAVVVGVGVVLGAIDGDDVAAGLLEARKKIRDLGGWLGGVIGSGASAIGGLLGGGAVAAASDEFEEEFDSFGDAVGKPDDRIDEDSIDVIDATNAGAIAAGFTEKWIGQDDCGEWWSAFRNPRTGKFSGGKPSSRGNSLLD